MLLFKDHTLRTHILGYISQQVTLGHCTEVELSARKNALLSSQGHLGLGMRQNSKMAVFSCDTNITLV
jgi:predicted component of type VI protein secretion system